MPPDELSAEFRELLSHSLKVGGLGIRNPVASAEHVHKMSDHASSYLVSTLVFPGRGFDVDAHNQTVKESCADGTKQRLEREQEFLKDLMKDRPFLEQQMERACETGLFLKAIPRHINGTVLGADEWRDNVRLRYNLLPLNLPERCDGCGAKFTVQHALSCRKGGLLYTRHNMGADEWRHLCGCATSFGCVEREPYITSCVSRQVRVDPQNTNNSSNNNNRTLSDQEQRRREQQNPPHQRANGERGDAGCHGFWQRGRPAIFDIRITDTQARSYRNKNPKKVLAAQEKEKKDKYLKTCHEMRKDFTPMVYSVDGMAGREAKNAEKRCAAYLAEKWERPYSQMVWYVRVRMSIMIVRANTLLLRGSRDRQSPRKPQISDRASSSDWRTWEER